MRAATCAVAAAVAAAHPAAAGDAAAGRQKATQCQACHGLDGLAKIPGAPHIAGQVEEYLMKSMRAYKSGARRDEMMSVVMRQLSEDDIADLAAYYAGVGGVRPAGSDIVP
jgi:cytochrome c553